MHRIRFIGIVLAVAVMTTTAPAQHTDERKGNLAMFEVPAAVNAEHERLHADLSAAIELGGKTGQAAKRLADVLHEHFVSEEELALPPLALLGPIAEGRIPSEMRTVIATTDRLKAEMPRMLDEHKSILQALDELGRAAQAEHHPEVNRFVEALASHAQTEEQVLYPAAILVGEYLKLKMAAVE
jgi:iron-sulfur cluster repair protein YtfE (RIC family)